MHQVLRIPLPPSLNQIINTSRSNKYAGATSKKRWTELVKSLAIEQGLSPMASTCWVLLHLEYKRTNSDPDNLQAGCLKVALDGLVAASILRGDSVKDVGSPLLTFFNKNALPGATVHLFNCPLEFEDYVKKSWTSDIGHSSSGETMTN